MFGVVVDLVGRALDASQRLGLEALGGHVERQGHEHRSTSTAEGRGQGLVQHRGGGARVRQADAELRHAAHHRDRVQPRGRALLQRSATEGRARHLPRDVHERHALVVGRGDPRERVRDARSGGRHDDPGAPRRHRVADREEGCVRLVLGRDDADVGPLEERVVERADRAARHAEDDVDAEVTEHVDEVERDRRLHRPS